MKKNLHLQFFVSTLLISLLPFLTFSQQGNSQSQSINAASGQQNEVIQKRSVLELEAAISSLLSSVNPVKVAEGQHLKSLAYDLLPTIYLIDGKQSNPSGLQPVCIATDVISVSALYVPNPAFNNVEFMVVKIKNPGDLSTVLNPDNFTSFSNLKYLCIKSSFEICPNAGCEASFVSQMVSPTTNQNLQILYQIAIPE